MDPNPKKSHNENLNPHGYSSILDTLDKHEEKEKKENSEEKEPSGEDVKEGLRAGYGTLDSPVQDQKRNSFSNGKLSSEDVFQQNNIEAPDTLDSLLSFLKTSRSPVKGLLDLRSLLLEQKEEKVMLRTLVDQMKVDISGLR